MKSILECSRRTVTKLIQRMKLGCFVCGWNECRGDVHHKIPTSKGGSDHHDNLTYLCPNCHRKAHNGMFTLEQMKSLQDVVGDSWKDFYNVTPRSQKKRTFNGKVAQKALESLAQGRANRSAKSKRNALEKIEAFKSAKIDTSAYGWIQVASTVLDVAPQKVRWYLRQHAPELLEGTRIRGAAKNKASVAELVYAHG